LIQTLLIDKTNFEQHALRIINEIKAASFVGLDTETQDDNRHEGLMSYCSYDPVTRKKAATAKTVFDIRRTVMTGYSVYPEGGDTAYYVNLNHADVENRLPWSKAKLLLEALPETSYWVAHNANYELTVFKSCYNFQLPRYIDTMQMAVSAFGPDEYDIREFNAAGQGEMKRLMPAILAECKDYDPDSPNDMPPSLSELVFKILAKESSAEHSYNGFVKSIAYSYGLKKLVKTMFGHNMTTFQQVLGDKAHMGQLTGAETVAYGADDAYWAMRLFRKLMDYMAKNSPAALNCFFTQENPMIEVFSNIWINGLKVNTDAVSSRRDLERTVMADILRGMKDTVQKLLPFQDEPYEPLLAEKWYKDGKHAKYRNQITSWAESENSKDDFTQCIQVRGPVSNSWSADRGAPEPKGPNFSHYMPIRVLIYDLIQTKLIRSDGKVQSDGECRGRLKDRLERKLKADIADLPPEVGLRITSAQAEVKQLDEEDEGYDAAVQRLEALFERYNLRAYFGIKLIEAINKIAGVEQRMKLYLTPYNQLMDPETGRMYPVVSSMLASRRMAASYPNPMQLAKRGESTYVRGFFEADYDDHVIVSIDWSAIELVEIGEFSGDRQFVKAFGQIPHEDLHAGAAADILSVDVPGLDEASFKALKNFKLREEYEEEFRSQQTNFNRLFTNLKGTALDIGDAYKYWRTEVGKGANFNYWYSGWLATIGERMGWDSTKTAEATDRYRSRFSEAEQWRVALIQEGQRNGYVTLPDGQRRVRFEATPMWADLFMQKFLLPGAREDDLVRRFNAVIGFMARKIQTRANNQLVNSMIQGSCATIAKRSVIRINDKIKKAGWTEREARFMIPIHDELVFSVHRDIVPEFISLARGTMIDHPDMFKLCKLDASPSVGLTFEPWSDKKGVLLGQVELFESPKFSFVPEAKWGGRLNDDEIRGVVDYLFEQRKLAA